MMPLLARLPRGGDSDGGGRAASDGEEKSGGDGDTHPGWIREHRGDVRFRQGRQDRDWGHDAALPDARQLLGASAATPRPRHSRRLALHRRRPRRGLHPPRDARRLRPPHRLQTLDRTRLRHRRLRRLQRGRGRRQGRTQVPRSHHLSAVILPARASLQALSACGLSVIRFLLPLLSPAKRDVGSQAQADEPETVSVVDKIEKLRRKIKANPEEARAVTAL